MKIGMILPSPHHATIPVAGFEAIVAYLLQLRQPVIVHNQKKSTRMVPKHEFSWKIRLSHAKI
jgi:hypothetical protein